MSRFDELLKSARRPTAKDETIAETIPTSKGRAATVSEPPSPAPVERKKMGRPAGKKSSEAYRQVTAYLPRELYQRVQDTVCIRRKEKEFSEVVAELLSEWLKGQTSG